MFLALLATVAFFIGCLVFYFTADPDSWISPTWPALVFAALSVPFALFFFWLFWLLAGEWLVDVWRRVRR